MVAGKLMNSACAFDLSHHQMTSACTHGGRQPQQPSEISPFTTFTLSVTLHTIVRRRRYIEARLYNDNPTKPLRRDSCHLWE